MLFRKKLLLGAVLGAVAATSAYADSQVTIIQTGDFHGHLTPRPNLRSNADYSGQMVGGLARIKTKIQEIQAGKGGAGNTLVLHTGDTIQGSGEALYTRGQAMVDVVDMLGIDAYAPGNWDYVYGPERFKEFFATSLNPSLPTLPEQAEGRVVAPPFGTRWGGVVSNLYVTSLVPSAPKDPQALGSDQDTNVSQAEYDTYAQWYADHGQRVLPPYSIRYVNGVKIGILGCTTSRGPQVVGKQVTEGLTFTDCAIEAPRFAEELRTKEGVQVVVLLSEIEIGRNIQLVKKLTAAQHIDVILNADMHEEVLKPIEVTDAAGNKTWIIEAGQDGTLVGEITLTVQAGQVIGMNHVPHRIDDRIVEDVAVAAKVAQVRGPFTTAFDATIPCDLNSPYWNTFTEATCLTGSLNDVVGTTDVALHRSNYSHQNMPAVIEGSSHDFVADAIRWWAQSDLATVRGFRYGTHIAPGPITRNDLFHIVPIGPRIAKVSRISANQLRNQIDNSSKSVFSTNPNTAAIPLPRYNNAAYAVGGANQNVSPGAGLPIRGLAGSPEGWGGGWLFAYSGNGGISFDFAPYYETNVIYNTDNTLSLTPPSNTSRARSLKVNLLCKDLPPAQIALSTCNVADLVTRIATTITTSADGVYTGSWKANYTNGQVKSLYSASLGYTNNSRSDSLATSTTTACTKVTSATGVVTYTANTCGYTPYLLNPDGWQFLNGTPNQPNTKFTVNQHFKAGLFTVAGYWYAKSPNSINNCNNCYPTGKNTVIGHPDAAYLLPVNANADGTAALDSNGNPIYVRDSLTNVVIMENGKPKIEGAPVDLTVIIEKYLASLVTPNSTLGTVNSTNLPLNRIGLVNNDGTGPISLPDTTTSTLGFPTMQPLCGTIGKTAATTLNCP